MPTTRKKVLKSYKEEEGSDVPSAEDFEDSGSEASISTESESSAVESESESEDDFKEPQNVGKKFRNPPAKLKQKFAKAIFKKVFNANNSQTPSDEENEETEKSKPFTVKDLTDADKLLPSVLNLSDSDSSDDDEPKSTPRKQSKTSQKNIASQPSTSNCAPARHQDTVTNGDASVESKDGSSVPYTDVWSKDETTDQIASAEVARKTFEQLQQKASELEQTKNTFQKYAVKTEKKQNIDVKDLLALGEDPIMENDVKRMSESSESENEDWEEVKETKAAPKAGIQLVVDFPDAASKKPKPLDLEMMMKRKINRVKKEYQVYMHKVHVLCWIAHGSYVNKILNDQDLMAASLSLLPSQHCYPSNRVDIKYLENISTWFKDKITLKLDKSENKFRPNAPFLKDALLKQINLSAVSSKKNLVLIFICIMRALGIKCRLMLNFVTLPIKPPSSELCSLSTKSAKTPSKDPKSEVKNQIKEEPKSSTKKKVTASLRNTKIKNISQLDGNDDSDIVEKPKRLLTRKRPTKPEVDNETVSPPKRRPLSRSKVIANKDKTASEESTSSNNLKKENINSNFFEKEELTSSPKKAKLSTRSRAKTSEQNNSNSNTHKGTKNSKSNPIVGESSEYFQKPTKKTSISKSSSSQKEDEKTTSREKKSQPKSTAKKVETTPKKEPNNKTLVHSENQEDGNKPTQKRIPSSRKLALTTTNNLEVSTSTTKSRTKSAPAIKVDKSQLSQPIKGDSKTVTRKRTLTAPKSEPATNNKNIALNSLEVPKEKSTSKLRSKSSSGLKIEKIESSKYFDHSTLDKLPVKRTQRTKKAEDNVRVSHRDLLRNMSPQKPEVESDVSKTLKNVVTEVKKDAKQILSKGRTKNRVNSDEDFKPDQVQGRQRRVFSTDEGSDKKRMGVDAWCEVYVEEEEQWISVDVVKGEVHCASKIYSRTTLPVCYIVGWDNNNYAKDVTRRYVPHWNTVTRKLRADPSWWTTALKPCMAPPSAEETREDKELDNMQRDAPLPTSIGEYKNHPLYALQRHLLKFEVIYPPDSATLGFVRGEAVYSRYCIHTCRSRDTWLKEARVVRPGETPYKIVKARPKYDRLSCKMITDIPLEIFGSWQTQEYEPPTAENGMVPRNAYGNVELFKQCMLPKGTVHLQLNGLSKVAKKLNIDCAPAMTGFDFHSGWTHPVYDGFVVCAEFEEVLRDAWVKDQEDMVRREREKIENRVYGNWKKLIRGLFIRERLRNKYDFKGPPTEDVGNQKKAHGPRLGVKK